MSIVRVKNSILDGKVTLPPSKSAAHRALICSYLAGGGQVTPLIDSLDMKATIGAIEALKSGNKIIDCIESGSTLRFMIPIAAALGKSVTFIGRGKLPQRPIGDYLRLLPEHNVMCESSGGLPLSINGKLTSGEYKIAGNISSQYITGLLLALPILDGDSDIVLTTPLESKPYVDMTIKVMSDYGVNAVETDYGYHIKGNQSYKKIDYIVEGDWSQAAFFLVAGALGKKVELNGLQKNSTQGDKEIIPILRQFGAKIEETENSIIVKKSKLKGIEIDAKNIPDMVPALAVLASFAEGKTVIKGAERLRLKESDRIESVSYNLKKMGVDIETTADGMIIVGTSPKGEKLKGFNDHRIVMAFAVAGAFASGETVIDDAQSINKSYPNFFNDFTSIGGIAYVINDR